MAFTRKGLAAKAALGMSAALVALALPSAGSAVGQVAGDTIAVAATNLVSFTPASADPRLAALVASKGDGSARMMRFTPAGAVTSGPNRSVTVAVRVDRQTAQSIAAARSALPGQTRADASATTALRVAPVRYNLGLARGYGSFAQAPEPVAPAASRIPGSLANANIPDLSEFTPRAGVREEPSRFAARVALEEGRSPTRARITPPREEALADQMLDVNGSYRLTRNLDITAGVRYEQDRDIAPLPDLEQQDSQAVYIGTQFRF
ncbi:hypothetical protein [Aurantiacibacter spongiae]|uniref:DUF481 domain-containing protein n=1 Tax=Aurantiacibacter spongiae TaxID=2488860 RepID=A0A3N5D9X7_9SPHN|nr:hypothetical protein [Aurantiacibacter spongiae]RPF71448.1 hypothetical protein EG799_07335 [Aurantiacibacter spongiae]